MHLALLLVSAAGSVGVSRPYDFKRLQHVDMNFNWTGQDLELTFEVSFVSV